MKGLAYEKFRYRDTDCYLLIIDLTKRSIRPVMAREQFPFRPAVQPAFDAIEQKAVAMVTDGFNIVVWNNKGVTDQPQHTLVLDQEIWTTGIGSGGFGFLIGDGWATTQKNQVQVIVWRPDGTSFEVGSINLGHDERIVAFTPRGGTNDYPMDGKHYTVLGIPGPWGLHGNAQTRQMSVTSVTLFTPPTVAPDTVVLESRWPLKLKVGDQVKWVQNIGAPNVKHIVSGWPEILHEGENVVHALFAVPSHGPDNWFVRKNPRTALGTSEDGKTAFMFVCQGRTKESKGLRLKEVGTLLQSRGVHNAVNMDGGGSAFMWFKPFGLVAPGCYNTSGTLEDGRPGHWVTSVF